MEWILLASALVAVGFSALLGSFFIKGTFNFLTKRTKGNTERFSSQSKPIYGGILFYSIFLVFSLIYFFSPMYSPDEVNTFISLMIIVSISFFMGLADDLLNTPPLFKFIVQFLCAFVLIKTGIDICVVKITAAKLSNSINNLVDAVTIKSLSIQNVFMSEMQKYKNERNKY